MSMYRGRYIIISGLIFILIVGIACNFPATRRLVPNDIIPVTTQAVENLQNNIQESIQNLQSVGEFTLVISEEEITSLAALELEKQADHTIQEPQIYLRDGKVQVAAKLIQGSLLTPIQLILSVEVDDNGYPSYKLISGTLGPVSLPEPLKVQFITQLDQILLERINSQQTSMIIHSIDISDGLMTIRGYKP